MRQKTIALTKPLSWGCLEGSNEPLLICREKLIVNEFRWIVDSFHYFIENCYWISFSQAPRIWYRLHPSLKASSWVFSSSLQLFTNHFEALELENGVGFNSLHTFFASVSKEVFLFLSRIWLSTFTERRFPHLNLHWMNFPPSQTPWAQVQWRIFLFYLFSAKPTTILPFHFSLLPAPQFLISQLFNISSIHFMTFLDMKIGSNWPKLRYLALKST